MRRLTYTATSLLLAAVAATAQNVITTVAGADKVFPAMGARASELALAPYGHLTSDAAGNLYFIDSGANRILRLTPGGILSVVAGNGIRGFSGDGESATRASLYVPYSIAADTRGNLFIADRLNHRIRRVSPDGIITTVAGTGRRGFSGDGGPAISATFASPQGIAVDRAGNIYVSDSENARVRRIDTNGVVTTIAGGATGDEILIGVPATRSPLATPRGIAVASDGTVYFSMPDVNVVVAVDPAGILQHIAGTGSRGFGGDGQTATSALLGGADGLALDSSGNLYIADYGNSRIRRVTPAGIISTVAGTETGFGGDGGPATQARMNFVSGVAIDSSGSLFISDNNNGRVRKVGGGVITTVAGSNDARLLGDGGPARSAIFYYSRQAVADREGNLYVLDTGNHRVRKVSRNGVITTYAGTGVSGFSGDGGPATNAALSTPFGIALDDSGNLYIADTINSRIRRVSSAGVITTVAGNGQYGYTGDNGPASQATLGIPRAVAVAPDGSILIAETATSTVRRIDRAGVITRVAGQPGVTGYQGDSGPAAQSVLSAPAGLAVDGAGNILIADSGNATVRRISGGVIATVAGTGRPGQFADGGRAASSPLGSPEGVAADRNGNVFIADSGHYRIRMVNQSGTITTVAGTGEDTFHGDGGIATRAALSPTGVSLDSTGQLVIADGVNNRVRVLLAAVPAVELQPAQLSFNGEAGGVLPPAQVVRLRGGVAGLAFTASASVAWIQMDQTTGLLPADIAVRVDPTQLSAGTHEGAITINTPSAVPPVRTVAVRFVVAPGEPAEIGVDRRGITFSFVEGDQPATSVVGVLNRGSGAAEWIAQPNTAARRWLTLSPGSGRASGATPASLTVTANPAGLSAGTYSGSIAVVSPTGGSETVPVVMTVARPQPKLSLTTSGLQFRLNPGGTALPRSFGIVNSGRGTMTWTASTRTLSGGQQWLRLNRLEGSVARPLLDVAEVEVSVDASGLAPGTYFGEVSILASGTAGAQSVVVTLNVLPAGSPLTAEVRPSTLVFAVEPGLTPGSRDAAIGNPSGSSLSFVSSSAAGASWLKFTPGSGTIPAGQTAQITVQPDYTQLSTGIHQDTINLQFSDGSAQALGVVVIVAGSGAAATSERQSHTNCSISSGKLSSLSGSKEISVAAGQPFTLETTFNDNCGHALTGGRGSATFSDNSISAVSAGNGRWTATWTPPTSMANQTVPVSMTVFSPGPGTQLLQDQVLLTLRILPAPPAPGARSSDVVNAASFAVAEALAPGALITVFGEEFVEGQGLVAPGAPLPTELGGTEVRLGDRPLPLLYAGANQINAQIPFELDGNVQHQLKIQRRQSLSVIDGISVADASPAVFTLDQSGRGQGAITNGVTGAVADRSSPVRAGDVISVYCTGLGRVSPAIPAGTQAPPSGPLSRTDNPVEVMIGGRSAPVQFSGLAPGFTGLYQVNAFVPEGVSGDAVAVVVSVLGRQSPEVTIAVR